MRLDDVILDVSLPSNRNEQNGYLWLIYELAAYFKIDVFKNPFRTKTKTKCTNKQLCFIN